MPKFINLIDGRTKYIMNYFIHDILVSKGYKSVYLGVDNLTQIDLDKKSRYLVLHLKYILATFKAILISNRDDLIICWLDIMGVYAFIIRSFLLKKSKILILNIMAPPNSNLHSYIRDKIYGLALNSKNTYGTVNSISLVDMYVKTLKIKKEKLFVLHDSLYNFNFAKSNYKPGKGYIFFGGTAGRDYNLIIKIANKLSNIQFIFAVRKKTFEHKELIPSNVKILFDIPSEQFYEIIDNSNLVVLPIKVDTPAGLIVLIVSGLKSKLIIASKTLSICEYIKNKETGILIEHNNFDDWCNNIEYYFNNNEKQKYLGNNLKKYLEIFTSNETYVNNLIIILSNIIKLREFSDENTSN